MRQRKAVITGMGVVSPVGSDLETFWSNVKEGKSGIGRITKFDEKDGIYCTYASGCGM